MRADFNIYAEFRSLVCSKSAVVALVGERVSLFDLPENFEELVRASQKCPQSISMELLPSDPDEQADPPIGRYRFSVFCWGASVAEAVAVANAVYAAFLDQDEVEVSGTTWKYTNASRGALQKAGAGWIFCEVTVVAIVDES